MSIINTLLAFLVTIMLLVFIHEYGHFKVARLCGVRVKRVSIGFGKPFYTKVDKHGTEWSIARFLLGGYVSMVDSRVEPLAPGEEGVAFDRKNRWQRAAIIAAGPLINLLFAWAVWSALMMGSSQELGPYLGSVYADSVASRSGFEPDDRIVKANDSKVNTLSELQLAMMDAAIHGKDSTLTVSRASGEKNLVLPTAAIDPARLASGEALREMGFANPAGARMPAKIRTLLADGPGAKGGLREGDLIVDIDGQPIASWSAMAAAVNLSAGKSLSVTVKDASGETRKLNITPEPIKGSVDQSGKIGAALDEQGLSAEQKAQAYVTVDRGAFGAMAAAAERCVKMTKATFGALGGMISGRTGADGIAGPIGIAQQAESAAEAGAASYLNFLAFLSLSLFIMNMMPLPRLDGGHLVMLAVEGVMRKPLSERIQMMVGQAGFVFLGGMMLLAIFNDVSKLFR